MLQHSTPKMFALWLYHVMFVIPMVKKKTLASWIRGDNVYPDGAAYDPETITRWWGKVPRSWMGRGRDATLGKHPLNLHIYIYRHVGKYGRYAGKYGICIYIYIYVCAYIHIYIYIWCAFKFIYMCIYIYVSTPKKKCKTITKVMGISAKSFYKTREKTWH